MTMNTINLKFTESGQIRMLYVIIVLVNIKH